MAGKLIPGGGSYLEDVYYLKVSEHNAAGKLVDLIFDGLNRKVVSIKKVNFLFGL